MKLLLTVTLLALSAVSFADSVFIGGASYHPSRIYKDGYEAKEFNEQNALFAYERKGYLVGQMKNSYYEKTTFVGKHFYKGRFGALVMASNKYELAPLPRIGSIAIGGFLTARFGPVQFLAVPTQVYVVTLKFDI